MKSSISIRQTVQRDENETENEKIFYDLQFCRQSEEKKYVLKNLNRFIREKVFRIVLFVYAKYGDIRMKRESEQVGSS